MTASLETVQWGIRIVLAAVFVGMGISHFLPGPGRTMGAMIPPALRKPGIPSARALVRFTGLCEIGGAVGLLVPVTRFPAGIALVLFLIAVFPANVYAAEHRERFGRLAVPFWPRYFAQLGLIGLCVLAVV